MEHVLSSESNILRRPENALLNTNMRTEFEVRDASPSDIAQIARVFRVAREFSLPYLPQLHTPEEDLQFFNERVSKTDRIVIVVEDEEVAGFCAFWDGWIDHLYALPEYQQRGIGTVLLREAMRTYPNLQLWVFQKNDVAKKFYEANGFQLAETTDGSGSEEREPDARYIWSKP
jgi:putative acetyltransferase